MKKNHIDMITVVTIVITFTGLEKETIKGYAHRKSQEKDEVKYECNFVIPEGYGEIGAVLVENEHHKEMYLKNIVFHGFPPGGPVDVTCNSWVASKFDSPHKRIFFTNKESGRHMRGYTIMMCITILVIQTVVLPRNVLYSVVNNILIQDVAELVDHALTVSFYLFPWSCSKTDPMSESRSSTVYVPRDEAFSDVKELTFSAKAVYSVLHALVPSLETAIVDTELGFPYFTAIDSLFNEGVNLPPLSKNGFLKDLLPRLVKFVTDAEEGLLRFETPALFERDKFSWFRDEEFSRQTLAGLNPYSIQLVKEWPLKSKLDPKIYGPPESAITKELIEREIRGFMTLEVALQKKKLFMLDYHDLLLPYVNKVRESKGTTLYGSRTIFFLTPDGTLMPLAIELTRPPLTTHCVTEPYIIASNRQLSAMHPIYRLLHPHFRYTMEINALAREALINAGGIIETCFSPGKYSIELSSVAYDQLWRFDLQALPADLISRGMAVEDQTAPHGLRLTIEDYPFANDGLLVWDAIKQWVTDYSDKELQAWWTEIRTVGHGDKKDEPWWPVLKTPQDLIGILTTMIWVTSGHHSAVNFGQYMYAGYFPNRPTIARTKMPTEDPTDEEWKCFINKPEVALLMCFPSQIQATKVMAVLDVLSNHSPDEEYLGKDMEASWIENPIIKAAFERFNGKLTELEGVIDGRNVDKNLKNRYGAGVVPYELLKPFSEPGVTGKGVPKSISI
ncbi:hypothetical protein CsSME_00040315 [Camellia sinensis var. sinensis]